MSAQLHLVAAVKPTSNFLRYGSTLGSVLLALILSLLMQPLITPNPFLLFFAAVAFSAWVGGLRTGVLAIGVAALFSNYFLLHPEYTLSLGLAELIRLGGFALVALLITTLSEAHRRATGEIRRLNADLEQRVAERTAQLESANHALTQANLTKDRFLASMSHELRTPLNAIIGFTGTLLMRLPGPLTADQEKQLRTIQSSAKHLLSLINGLLDIAKIEAGQVELTHERVVCQELFEEIATSLRSLAQAKGIDLDVVLPDDQIVVWTDRRTLSQILINLVNNAIKFTEQGSVRLELRQRQENGHRLTEIAVADTGIGIRPEDQTKLFQAFSQVDAPGQRRYEGTGLGLHLSREFAHLLGGQITVQSEYGKGSTFTLILPG